MKSKYKSEYIDEGIDLSLELKDKKAILRTLTKYKRALKELANGRKKDTE